MDIGATIARIIQAVTRALASMTRATKRWCAKSSTWVYDRVVEPAVDYTGEACSGALAGVMGFMPDVIDATARLPGQAIRGTGAVLEGGGRLIGNTFTAAASVPGKVVIDPARRRWSGDPASGSAERRAEVRRRRRGVRAPGPTPVVGRAGRVSAGARRLVSDEAPDEGHGCGRPCVRPGWPRCPLRHRPRHAARARARLAPHSVGRRPPAVGRCRSR